MTCQYRGFERAKLVGLRSSVFERWHRRLMMGKSPSAFFIFAARGAFSQLSKKVWAIMANRKQLSNLSVSSLVCNCLGRYLSWITSYLIGHWLAIALIGRHQRNEYRCSRRNWRCGEAVARAPLVGSTAVKMWLTQLHQLLPLLRCHWRSILLCDCYCAIKRCVINALTYQMWLQNANTILCHSEFCRNVYGTFIMSVFK